MLATRLENAAADLVAPHDFGCMVASLGDWTMAVPLSEVAGKRRTVPIDDPLVVAAKHVGTCLG